MSTETMMEEYIACDCCDLDGASKLESRTVAVERRQILVPMRMRRRQCLNLSMRSRPDDRASGVFPNVIQVNQATKAERRRKPLESILFVSVINMRRRPLPNRRR